MTITQSPNRSILQFSLVLALLAATLFRALPLLDNRFHPDEALYASFAQRIVSGRDVLLSGVVVDKPPLPFYLTASSFALFGGTEFAARLPTFYASVISVALLFVLARRLYGPVTAVLAAWWLALSPFAILFSITLFIDPLMLVFVLWGLWAALAGRRWQTGAAFALAFAAKQTALLFLPLAGVFVLLSLPQTATPRLAVKKMIWALWPLLVCLGVAVIVIFSWDAVRHAPIGFWDQGYSDNTPGRFIRANEVLPRAFAWLDWLQYFTAAPLLNGFFILGLPVLLGAAFFRATRASLADFMIAGYLMLYLAAYWLLAFNVWDRYLVPLLPLLVLLLARVISLISNALSRFALYVSRRLGFGPLPFALRPLSFVLLPLSFILLLLPSAFSASRSAYPVGGDHGAYDGIDDAARFIHTLPAEGVLYDHWLGWELGFYLFDGPLYVSWFPSPDILATDLAAFGRTSPRYLIMPSWEAEAEVRAAVALAGFEPVLLHTSYRRDGSASFAVYQLVSR